MSFPIAPANQQKVGYELVSLPSHGKLTLSDVDMKVGDKYTQEDVSQGRFKYVQNKPLTSKADVTDTFKFKIWEKDKFNNLSYVIGTSKYTACMPVRPIETPNDGIFTFSILIGVFPSPTGSTNGETGKEESLFSLGTDNMSYGNAGSTPAQITYTLTAKLKYGTLLVNGVAATSWTQADVDAGRVTYKHNGGLADENIMLSVCNQKSKCVSASLTLKFTPILKLSGPNVFYGKVGSKWSRGIGTQANRTPVYFEIVGANNTPSPDTAAPPANNIIGWSVFNQNCTYDPTKGLCGQGWDKLPKWRNKSAVYQSGGGLPTGLNFDVIGGTVWTDNKIPYNPNAPVGGSPYYLPTSPGEWKFTVKITDPKTDETYTRDYYLRVTSTGFGLNGESTATI